MSSILPVPDNILFPISNYFHGPYSRTLKEIYVQSMSFLYLIKIQILCKIFHRMEVNTA
jgi:hypothetical protein